MGCGCGAKSEQTSSLSTSTMFLASSECNYTIEQVDEWLSIVHCLRDNGRYLELGITKFQLNLYTGILISTQNYKKNVCYFEKELNEIESFITVVKANDICTTL